MGIDPMTAAAASQPLEVTTDTQPRGGVAARERIRLTILVAGALVIRVYRLGDFPDTILAAGTLNLLHYAAWQSSPKAQQARQLYVTRRKFHP